MRINSHAHMFTLRTILNREVIHVMSNRLRDANIPDFIVKALEDFLDGQLNHPEYLVQDELLKRFVGSLIKADGFTNFLNSFTDRLPVEVQILGEGVTHLGTAALKASLARLSSLAGGKVDDIFEALSIAMQPDVTHVVDHFLNGMDKNDAIVSLMMDIVGAEESERDKRNFRRQVEETKEAALQRPGRILPFIPVNPSRPNHFDIMKKAIEEHGFIGVKLYPSLGFEVDSPELLKVYDYCLQADVPLLMHCSHGGFYKEEDFKEYCSPEPWAAILEERPNLRLCFAHFGGWESLGKAEGLEPGTWGRRILDLMKYPNVFTDLAYHVEMMLDDGIEKQYFGRLQSLLDSQDYGDRFIFGTDSWLLRLDVEDAHYWNYFQNKLGPVGFTQIAEKSPYNFLGLPGHGSSTRLNIERFVTFMKNNRDRVGAEPADWLREEANVAFKVIEHDSRWHLSNTASKLTYIYLKKLLPNTLRLRKFANNANTRLKDLKYWTKGHESDSLFKQRCSDHARTLVAFCKKNGGIYEGSYDDTSAVNQIIEMLEDGNKKLVDVATCIDFMLIFNNDESIV